MVWKRILSMVALTAIVGMIISACGGGDATTAPAATPSKAPAGTTAPQPTTGPAATPTTAAPRGEFRMALSAIPSWALLPGLNCCTNRYHLDPMYDAMVGSAPGLKLSDKSGFATSWTASADGLSWTFKLRDGLVFQDGSKATAQDFAYSTNWYRSPLPKASYVYQFFAGVSDVQVVDEFTVTTKLSSANIFFVVDAYSFGPSNPTGYLVPKNYYEANGAKLTDDKAFTLDTLSKNPIGSGPYKHKSSVVNQELVLEGPARAHWLFGMPKYATSKIFVVQEDGTRTALLKSGGTEFAEIPRGEGAAFKTAGFDVKTKDVDRYAWVQIHEQWKTEYPGYGKNPLNDLRVRRAMSLAIDRDVLNKQFMAGLAQPSGNTVSTPLDPAYIDVPAEKQDMAKAKALMAEAGFAKGFELEYWIWQLPGIAVESPQMVEAMAGWWGELGIKTNRKTYDVQLTLTAMAKGGDRPLMSGPWAGGSIVHLPGLRPGVKYKDIGTHVQEDPEIEAAASAINIAKSTEEYITQAKKFQQLSVERVERMSLFFYGTTYAMKAGIGGDKWVPGNMPLGLNTTGIMTNNPAVLH